jgi:asparagine synthase (glutamine-hydrolysing)
MRRNGHISWRNAFSQATTGMLPDRVDRYLRQSGEFTMKYSAASEQVKESYKLHERMLKVFYDNSGDLRKDRVDFFERFDYGVFNAAVRGLHGVDMRDPLGDKRLFEFCYSIPIEQFIVDDMPRSLIRRAMKGRLPEATLARSMRGQQGADWYLSMQDARPSLPAAAEVIERSPTAQRMLDLPRMRELLATWPENGLEELDTSHSYGDALCRFMSFGHFLAKEDEAVAAQAALPDDAILPASST